MSEWLGRDSALVEHEQSKDALRHGWEDFARAQELGQIGWWRLDTRQNILTWSDESYRVFGAPEGTPQNYQSFLAIVHPDDRDYVHTQWMAALKGEPYDIEHRIIVNGRVKWVREKAHLEFDESGALQGGFGITQDITERKQATEALQWNVRRNELLSRTAARLLQSSDAQTVVNDLCREVMDFLDCQVFFNFLQDPGAGRLRLSAYAGVSEEEAKKIEWLDHGVTVCGGVAHDATRVVLENVLSDTDVRTELIRSFGIQAYCCHPLLAQGQVIGTLSFGARMRTALNASEIEVTEAVSQLVSMAMSRIRMEQALRESDRRKDEFLATLSHELRNPLAPIHSAVQILRRSVGDTQRIERILEMVERQVNHLMRLVDDLLEVSRISRGKVQLKKERVDVVELIRHAIDISRSSIEQAKHTLTVTLPSKPLRVEADPVRLTQIFANLLDNAVKYTPSGGRIELTAKHEGGEAVIAFRDTGIGIPRETLPHVFDLFAQVDRNLGRAQGGLGIGLALVKSLVEMHGGIVHAQSDGAGSGSIFTVRLPLCVEDGAETSAEMTSVVDLPPLPILIVDDNVAAADSLGMLLELSGATTTVVHSGVQALQAIDKAAPRVVLLDLGLPGMDGFEVARRIRQHPNCKGVTLIALTGWSQDDDFSRSREAGFDHHLIKPADLDKLNSILRSIPS
jgi:PAS domain S-box-containing protein